MSSVKRYILARKWSWLVFKTPKGDKIRTKPPQQKNWRRENTSKKRRKCTFSFFFQLFFPHLCLSSPSTNWDHKKVVWHLSVAVVVWNWRRTEVETSEREMMVRKLKTLRVTWLGLPASLVHGFTSEPESNNIKVMWRHYRIEWRHCRKVRRNGLNMVIKIISMTSLLNYVT